MYHPTGYYNDGVKSLVDINSVVFKRKVSERKKYYNLLKELNIGPISKGYITR